MSGPGSRPRALITGASAGIGAAYAERLARDGYDVVLVARRRDRLEALAERLRREANAHAEVLAADLTDPGALAQVEARAAGDESLALLVNNAGFGGYGPFVQVDPEVVDGLIDIHIRAVARLTRAALPGNSGMRRARAFGEFAWEFVVGDDWRIAVGVVLALALTALIADTSMAAWWVLPIAVAMVLAGSVLKAATTPTLAGRYRSG